MLPTTTASALALTLVGLTVAPLPGPVPAPQEASHFPVPEGALIINAPEDSRFTMEELLVAFSELTGQQIHMSAQARNTMAQTDVGLLGSVHVPGDQLYSFLENLLFQNGFVMAELRSSEPRLLGIHSLWGNESHQISRFVEVPGEQIARYADHPALLVQSVIDVGALEARQVVNSLRPLMRNTNYQTMLAAGNGNSVIMRGTGADLAGWASLLEKAVEYQEAWLESLQQQADPQDG